MYLVYSALALAEVFVFLASAVAVLALIVRAIYKAFIAPKEELAKVDPKSLQHLKRAGAS